MAKTAFRAGEADFKLIWHGKQVEKAVQNELVRAMLIGGEMVRSQAAGDAPVLTGTYKRSLAVGVRSTGYSDTATGTNAVNRILQGDVKVAGDILETHVGTFVRYAYSVERRHATLLTALISKKAEVVQFMKASVAKLLR